MRYLLDTNVCIEILRGRNPSLKTSLAARNFVELALCSIVWAELQCGAQLAQNPGQELARLQNAFGHWPRLPFDDPAAESYGEIRAHLHRTGSLIGGNDLLIAAIARANGLTLVTHNTHEFARVPDLPLEDWQG
jgi:tRNA(fMet)-specific endonuclease VapC